MALGVYDVLLWPLEEQAFRQVLQGTVYAAKRQRSLQSLRSDYQYAVQQRDMASADYQARNQLLHHLHHELRTPLNAVVGYSQLLVEQSQEDSLPTYTEILKNMQDTGGQVLRLVNHLLELAKLESGMISLEFQFIDLKDLLDEESLAYYYHSTLHYVKALRIILLKIDLLLIQVQT